MHTAVIGIGSNLGERTKNCEDAISLIKKHPQLKLIAKSNWYETEALIPEGGKPAPSFINGAVKIETDLPPPPLLSELKKIEVDLGRVPPYKKWEPRIIDLDILFYDDLILDTPTLKIPHPELHKRMFVLKPLCDTEPDLIHPVLKKSVKQLREEIYENFHR